MGYARCLGALTIGISCNSEAPLSREVDIPIEIETGSEIIAGSTRMKAGTAQKMVLNMISTATMIRLGHVYDNLMVNLQPKNQKLISRAVTIVSQITEAPREEAARALKDCGSVTAAAAFLKFRCSIGEAKRLSQEYSNLRELLEADIAKK
jgi:N-acetylmuramic acid 6-phosphate etherase